ncbi:MAG TPA: hypothetical protein VMB24_01395 [Dehalococcoidales bacterium]|nr:hypothetical protein [Dehalococcoidales bacterium]
MKTEHNERKNKNIPLKILISIFSVWLIVDIFAFHLVSNLIFWVIAIIEIGIGILFSKFYYRLRKDKKYTRSNFWFLPLLVIGTGAPIIIYLLIPSLGRVDAALVVFFVAIEASALYYSKIESLRSRSST